MRDGWRVIVYFAGAYFAGVVGAFILSLVIDLLAHRKPKPRTLEQAQVVLAKPETPVWLCMRCGEMHPRAGRYCRRCGVRQPVFSDLHQSQAYRNYQPPVMYTSGYLTVPSNTARL